MATCLGHKCKWATRLVWRGKVAQSIQRGRCWHTRRGKRTVRIRTCHSSEQQFYYSDLGRNIAEQQELEEGEVSVQPKADLSKHHGWSPTNHSWCEKAADNVGCAHDGSKLEELAFQ